jgi:2'-5' RNA ligase superfamily
MVQHPAGNGYALWLMPGGQTYRQLARRILAFSRRHSTPRFEPHVTLLSGIILPEPEAVSRAATLARRLTPFEVRLDEVAFAEEYFRCIFLCVMPADALLEAHQAACEVFGLCDQPTYTPHLSLMYGSLPPEVKKRIAAGPSARLSFQAVRLHLYSVNGRPDVWRPAGTFNLG